MPITLDGGAGVTYPDGVQQTNAVTNTGGDPRYYPARAWANINGNTATIRAAVNVASVSSAATGRYTITFATNMPDANYSIVATAGDNSTTVNYYNVRIYGAPTASGFTVQVYTQNSGVPSVINVDYVHVVVFR